MCPSVVLLSINFNTHDHFLPQDVPSRASEFAHPEVGIVDKTIRSSLIIYISSSSCARRFKSDSVFSRTATKAFVWMT